MRFLRSGAIYAAANVASAAVPFALLPLLTRALTPAEYGDVVSFSLIVVFCMSVAGFNAHAALGVAWFTKPKEEVPGLMGTAIVLAVGSTVVVALIGAGLLVYWPTLFAVTKPGWVVLAAFTAGANVILQCRLVLWQSQQRPVANAILQITASLLNLALSLIGVILLGLGSAGRNGGIAAAAVAMALTAVTVSISAREVRFAPRWSQVRELVAFGAPLVLHTLAGVLVATADRWVVAANLGSHALGVYGAGAQLGMVMAIMADAFVKAYGPWIYAKLASKRVQDAYCVVGAIYLAMPTFFVLAALLGAVLYWLSGVFLGERYAEAVHVLPWFMLGGAFTGVYLCTSVLFFFSARTGLLALTTFSAAVCGTVNTVFLVHWMGTEGAAIGYAITQGLLAAFTSVVAMIAFKLPWLQPGHALREWRCSLRGPASS